MLKNTDTHDDKYTIDKFNTPLIDVNFVGR